MSDTLYLQLDQNIEVTNPHVYLQISLHFP